MKKYFDIQANPWLIHVLPLGILLIRAIERNFPQNAVVFNDPFHHGEYVATLPSVLAGKMDFFNIHGALDWIPAWLSHYFVGPDKYFLPTMFIYDLLSVVAGLFLYLLVVQHTNLRSKFSLMILFASATLVSYLVGYRDLFLLVAIWLYFYQQNSMHPLAKTYLVNIALGIVVAINMAWSFDRGIAGIAGVLLPCLLLSFSQRRFILTICSFSITIFALTQAGILSLTNYYENFLFLLNTSSQWSYGLSAEPVYLTVVVFLPTAAAIYILGKKLYRLMNTNRQESINLLVLLILNLLMFKIGTNRADAGHVVMAMWMPMLSFLYLSKDCQSEESTVISHPFVIALSTLAVFLYSASYPLFILLAIPPLTYVIGIKKHGNPMRLTGSNNLFLVLVVIIVLVECVKVNLHYIKGEYSWMSSLPSPPNNHLIVDKSINWVSAEILDAKPDCIFDMTNSGLINGLTNLPACTKYTYLIYATQEYDVDILQHLQQRAPPVIVYSSHLHAMGNMHAQFPKLESYLVKAYPYETCKFDYCLRYIKRPELRSITQ